MMARMKTQTLKSLCATGAIACCLITASAWAADYLENFDTYVPGSIVGGQGGWKGWDNDPLVVATTYATPFGYSPLNSVFIYGSSGTSYTDLVHEWGGYVSGHVVFSARQYIPTTSTAGTSYFILLDNYHDGAGAKDWAAQTTFNLATGKVHEDNSYTGTVRTDRDIVRNQWVEIEYDIFLTGNTATSYYNGQVFSQGPWHGTGVNAINALMAVDLYSDVSHPVYYDDIKITVIPEPASVTLFAVFGLIAGAWLRRKNA